MAIIIQGGRENGAILEPKFLFYQLMLGWNTLWLLKVHTVRSTTKKMISSEKKSTEKLKYTLKIFNKNGGAEQEEKRNKKEMYETRTKWKMKIHT